MRKGIPKIKANLPTKSQKIEPVDGFPIFKTNKETFQARCTECKFEFPTNWDHLTNLSVENNCSVCRHSKPVVLKFNSLGSDYRITSFRHDPRLDQSVNPKITGIPLHGAMAIITHEPCGSQLELALNSVKNIYRPSQSVNGVNLLACKHCDTISEQQNKVAELARLHNSPLIEKAKKVWGNGIKIEAQSDGFLLDVPSFEPLFEPNRIPIKAIVNQTITGRLKGKIKGHITEAMLGKWLEQDESLIDQTKQLQQESEVFGATLIYVAYRPPKDNPDFTGSGFFKELPKKEGIYFRYQKATKHFSNWQTRFRAKDTNFGLTGIKSDQLLIACAIAELFPMNEDGIAVEWAEDSRTIFENNKELDIGSINLLPHLGGIQIEYQGHQAHREDPDTMARDEKKRLEAKSKKHFFMQIDRVNHLSPEKALIVMENAIQKYSGNEKNEFIKYKNLTPNVENIRQDYIDRLPEQAQKTTNKLFAYCEKYQHKLITQKKLFLSSDVIDYRCGNCRSKKTSVVKTFIETETHYCQECKGDAITQANKLTREVTLKSKLGKLWNDLSDDMQHQLINNPIKAHIICPLCNLKNSCKDSIEGISEQFIKFSGFLCCHCLNTGEKKFPEGKSLNDYTQWESSVVKIIETTGWGEPKNWYEYVSSAPSDRLCYTETEITVTLTCNKGHEHCHSTAKWRSTLNSKKRNDLPSYCDICNPIKKGKGLADEEHLKRARKFHPNAEFTEELTSSFTQAICGEKTVIGAFTIEHPKINFNIKKQKWICKNKKQGEFSACLCCSVEKKWVLPGGGKTLEALSARLKMRAAFIATQLHDTSISQVSIITPNKKPTDEVLGSEHLLFQCHISEHPPTLSNHGNFFNASRLGYCKICLSKLHVEKFNELTKKY
jgi:hypothetical protein